MIECPRRIAHLDMDAFYASVELLRYPDLRGLPVVIGGGRDAQPVLQEDGTHRYARLRDYVGRGVITTATYEARALGVGSEMCIRDRVATRLKRLALFARRPAHRRLGQRA